jgi:hypothetical protein
VTEPGVIQAERIKVEGKFVFGGELSAMLPKLLKTDPKLLGASVSRDGSLPNIVDTPPLDEAA